MGEAATRRDGDPIALYTHLRYASPRAPVVLESLALRRPELMLRRIRYRGVTVEERLLTRVVEEPPRPRRMQAMLLLRGELHYGGPRLLDVGCVLLAHPRHRPLFRYRNADFLQLEWDTDERVDAPTALPQCVDATDGEAIFDEEPPTAQRARFHTFLAVFRRAGVTSLDFDVDRMVDLTTAHEIRLAATLREQLQGIRAADATALGELAGLSPRQLQRMARPFYEKYGFSLASWRETRKAWRVTLATVLLSRPELTVAAIADEVGYSSISALGRAFLKAGHPPPAALHKLLLRPIDS